MEIRLKVARKFVPNLSYQVCYSKVAICAHSSAYLILELHPGGMIGPIWSPQFYLKCLLNPMNAFSCLL